MGSDKRKHTGQMWKSIKADHQRQREVPMVALYINIHSHWARKVKQSEV